MVPTCGEGKTVDTLRAVEHAHVQYHIALGGILACAVSVSTITHISSVHEREFLPSDSPLGGPAQTVHTNKC